ncbi:hypothetical protein, partial [Acinetobacter nosocomialis]|uniref:hypothetical protein n=1 Tax=Acinetobacter nosocomialis TaxID=106654 RepID=UPI001C080376
MTRANFAATFIFGAATLFSAASVANAAQCGSTPAGFEAWKREFGAEAQGKGVGPTALSALM